MKIAQDACAQEKKELPAFKAGDTVTVTYKIKEENKERLQKFRGVVMQKRGFGATKTFTIRKISNGVGVGCTNFDPKLSDDAANLYALTADSVVCVDKGGETEASSAEGAIDLVGNPRLDWKNGIVDMGCYEFVPSHDAKPLSAVIDVKVSEGYGAKDVVFTVIPVGDCTDGLSWCWHFGDGQTDTESLSLTHRYQPGDYTAYLSLTNELGEDGNCVFHMGSADDETKATVEFILGGDDTASITWADGSKIVLYFVSEDTSDEFADTYVMGEITADGE